MTTTAAITLRMPSAMLWLLRIGAGVLGLVLGLLVKPLVRWAVDAVGGAPGPLRLAAALPTAWAVAVLTVIGIVAGIWLAESARRESLVLTVGPTGVQLTRNGADRYLARESVGTVFRDGSELVLLDADTRELARYPSSDLDQRSVRAAFERFGYPWVSGGDPHEREFRRWVDGDPALDDRGNGLLRARARALADKQEGRAAELTDELQSAGIVVRDRAGAQQYRRLSA